MPKYSPAVAELLPHEKYYLTLGRFIQRYVGIETRLQAMLWLYSEVSPTVARSIFSGVRVDQATSFIRRLHKSRGIEMHPLMEDTLNQIGVVNTARNMIIHHGAEFEEGSPQYVTNQRIANRPEEAQRFPISPTVLEYLISDVSHIHLRLNLFIQREQTRPSRFDRAADKMLRRAWRYKHVVKVGTRP